MIEDFDAVFWVRPGRRSVRTRERAAQRHTFSVSRKCDAKPNVILRHIEGLMSDFDINLLEELWVDDKFVRMPGPNMVKRAKEKPDKPPGGPS